VGLHMIPFDALYQTFVKGLQQSVLHGDVQTRGAVQTRGECLYTATARVIRSKFCGMYSRRDLAGMAVVR
jgi:hypothetical protein